jgi:uncharacterized protein (TIGR03118 family)
MKKKPFGISLRFRPDRWPIFSAAILLSAAFTFTGRAQNNYVQQNLVSDIPGMASHFDPHLVNPWGITSSSTSPFWVADNGTNQSTLYNSSGTPQGLVVSLPSQSPTGVVFNSTTAFNGDLFIFATETGAIDGWRGALGTTAEVLVNNGGAGSVYKGLAIATQMTGTYLYAADFHNATITVVPSTGAPALPGAFFDPALPTGYAPFNIQNVNGSLLVTYALQDATGHDEISGAGFGFVDRYDLNGNFLQRLISNGPLNSPWGLAIAPANFGLFSNDLLVGNFGDGRINAFNPLTGVLAGTLDDISGNPIEIPGLWGLRVGNGGSGGDPNSVYFAAGIAGPDQIEDHGLFGSLSVVPDSGTTLILLVVALGAMTCCSVRCQSRDAS